MLSAKSIEVNVNIFVWVVARILVVRGAQTTEQLMNELRVRVVISGPWHDARPRNITHDVHETASSATSAFSVRGTCFQPTLPDQKV